MNIDNYVSRPREDFYVDEEFLLVELLEKRKQYQDVACPSSKYTQKPSLRT